MFPFENLESGTAAFGGMDPVAGGAQQSPQRRENARLVIDQEQGGGC